MTDPDPPSEPAQSVPVIDRTIPVVPIPVATTRLDPPVTLDAPVRLRTDPADLAVARVGGLLARSLGVEWSESDGATVELLLGGDPSLGAEGYELTAAEARVTLRAHRPAGLCYGAQTLRQLLPVRAGLPVQLPVGHIRDVPRFAWRGLLLDVARHFFGVDAVKRVLDLAALYKINVLHLHLTDDQGWRIAIDSWPDLTAVGGRTEVDGGAGGFYTKADYAEIVAYAADLQVTVVPEIDVPGHTNAALTSYPELNCDGRPPPPFTGVDVGFSSLCPDKPVTYRFLEHVFSEIAAMTPGPYLHIGGDEALILSAESYRRFMERVQQIVIAAGKIPIGWQEIGFARLLPGTVVQYWNTGAGPALAVAAVRQGAKVVVSPADRTYLDMKYQPGTRLGQDWAGHVEVRDAYEWDPAGLAGGIAEADILGVEAALWTETITSLDEIETMLLPRLAAVAEVAWSSQGARSWADFRERVARHAPRWAALGASYYPSPQVAWPSSDPA